MLKFQVDPAIDSLETCRKPGDGMVMLVKGHNIWIKESMLMYIQRYESNPGDMTRYLLELLIGRQKLKNMCARGNSKNTEGVPADIINVIECKIYFFW